MVFSSLYDINVVKSCMYFKYKTGLSDRAVCLFFLFCIFWLLADFIFFQTNDSRMGLKDLPRAAV